MNKTMVVCALALASVGTVACSSSSKGKATTNDAGATDSSAPAEGRRRHERRGIGPSDASPPPDMGGTVDSGGPATLLVTYGVSTSALYAVDVAGKSLAGTLDFPGAFGAPFDQATAPFLLEQAADVVARLDTAKPWTIDSTWNVALTDATDGGAPYWIRTRSSSRRRARRTSLLHPQRDRRHQPVG